MASKEHDNNCINCLHRHEKETHRNCTICFRPVVKGNAFPGWEPEKKP